MPPLAARLQYPLVAGQLLASRNLDECVHSPSDSLLGDQVNPCVVEIIA